MDAFRELRPESIVGTLGSIPDLTAAQFALVFYELLGEGWPIGTALWQARRSLLEAPFHNPLGLLFVSYSGEDVHFARPTTVSSVSFPMRILRFFLHPRFAMAPIDWTFVAFGAVGGLLPDAVRFAKDLQQGFPDWFRKIGYWAGLLLLVVLGGFVAWLGRANSVQAALAMGTPP